MFDKNKPYGTVMGGSLPYLYEQGGKKYNASYEEVNEDGKKVTSKSAPPLPQKEPTDPPAESGTAVQSEPVDIDKLKTPEIKARLDELNVSYNPSLKKALLLAILKAEIEKQKAVE